MYGFLKLLMCIFHILIHMQISLIVGRLDLADKVTYKVFFCTSKLMGN